MYLAIPTQPDCATAWLAAVKAVDAHDHHEAANVIVDVANPTLGGDLSHPVVAKVDSFLRGFDKSVETVANTIFPRALYRRHGHPEFIKFFHEKVLDRVRKGDKWSGYYFERMTSLPVVGRAKPLDQLSYLIDRLKNPDNPSKNKYEVSLFDPDRDLNGSVYGGQCLSFLSFHVHEADGVRTLRLTAQYRNQYYIEKLLGNLIGLGRLLEYVAKESKLAVGSLTIVSTHAHVDVPKTSVVKATRSEVTRLISECEDLLAVKAVA